jgi:hypothetical protein
MVWRVARQPMTQASASPACTLALVGMKYPATSNLCAGDEDFVGGTLASKSIAYQHYATQ